MAEPTKVLIADDHPLIRRGLTSLVESRPGWQVCGQASTGLEAITQAEKAQPDVAIIDLAMPEMNGLEAAEGIRKISPKTEILIVSADYSDVLVATLIEKGMRGYILKADAANDLFLALDALRQHKPFYTRQATAIMLERRLPVDRLTAKEREMISLLAAGRNRREAGKALGLRERASEDMYATILKKIRVNSKAELIRYSIRNRIIGA